MYDVGVVGVAVTGLPVAAERLADGAHEYVRALLAVSIADAPIQRLSKSLVTLTFGSGFTVIVVLAEFVHPLASVPLTVYTVVFVGERLVVAPFGTELFVNGSQLYVAAPLAVTDTLFPSQMDDTPGFIIIVGKE